MLLLGPEHLAGVQLAYLVPVLELHVTIGEQVVVPLRVVRGASGGGDRNADPAVLDAYG
jgi:hypothetical protein